MTKTPHGHLKTSFLLGLLALLLLAPACKPDGDGNNPDETPEPTDTVYLSPTDHLVRASMALRGIRPSVAELDAVATDPNALEGIVDTYLESDEFGETVMEVFNEAWLSRAENIIFPPVGPLAGTPLGEINQSLTDAPLQLIRYVAVNDLPFTEIVTADYTMANEITATVWGLPYSGSGEWEVTTWTNGAPPAGVLADSWLFERHRSAGFNYNRGRANQVTKALLCYDFLASDVVIDGAIDLSDPDAIADAVQNNPACASCHVNLDPLAGLFFGHAQVNPGQITDYPIDIYVEARENQWQTTTLVQPGYFGVPATDLTDLAQLIAADESFGRCAAQRTYSYMAQTGLYDIGSDFLEELRVAFVDSGYNYKALAKAVVLSDEFRVSHSTNDEEADYLVGYKKVRPDQLERMMTDLTGFAWQTQAGNFGVIDLGSNSLLGFEVLGGGIDSFFVTQPSHTINATASLFLRAYAAEAAGYVVESDFGIADKSARKLLTAIDETDSEEAAVRAQLVNLHERLYAEMLSTDATEIDESYAVFVDTLDRTGDVKHAWKTTLTALLQDVKVAYY